MLKAAQMYQNGLYEKFISTWYDMRYMYYSFGTGDFAVQLDDNNINRHNFVSVNKNDEIIGYIQYYLDWTNMSVEGIMIVSFDMGNPEFIRDVYKVIDDIFTKYNLNRLEFEAIVDNPATKSYKKYITKYGGVQSGYSRQAVRLNDGKLHDVVKFEILRDDYLSTKL